MMEQQNQILQIISIIPDPWRSFVCFVLLSFLGFLVIKLILYILLFIEFSFTQQLRLHKHKPLPGTFFFDRIVEFCLKLAKVLLWILIVFIFLGVIIWYVLPFINDPIVTHYLKLLFSWMY
jgi:hypothetical protein